MPFIINNIGPLLLSLCVSASLFAAPIRVGEILPRLDNLEKLVEQLRQRVKSLPHFPTQPKELSSLNLVDKAIKTMKSELGLYEPAIAKAPDHMVAGDQEKYSNLAAIVITINLRTCEQVVNAKNQAMQKITNAASHEKIFSNMKNNCQTVKTLISRPLAGQDLSQLQLDLNKKLVDLIKLW